MTTDSRTVGARIRALRIAKGLGLGELADKLVLSKGYLSTLETGGAVNPTLDVLKRIADALDVTIAELFGAPVVKAKLDIPENVPEGLVELAKERRAAGKSLESSTVLWLANARYRGTQPKTKEDFAFLLRSLEATTTSGKK